MPITLADVLKQANEWSEAIEKRNLELEKAKLGTGHTKLIPLTVVGKDEKGKSIEKIVWGNPVTKEISETGLRRAYAPRNILGVPTTSAEATDIGGEVFHPEEEPSAATTTPGQPFQMPPSPAPTPVPTPMATPQPLRPTPQLTNLSQLAPTKPSLLGSTTELPKELVSEIPATQPEAAGISTLLQKAPPAAAPTAAPITSKQKRILTYPPDVTKALDKSYNNLLSAPGYKENAGKIGEIKGFLHTADQTKDSAQALNILRNKAVEITQGSSRISDKDFELSIAKGSLTERMKTAYKQLKDGTLPESRINDVKAAFRQVAKDAQERVDQLTYDEASRISSVHPRFISTEQAQKYLQPSRVQFEEPAKSKNKTEPGEKTKITTSPPPPTSGINLDAVRAERRRRQQQRIK